MMEVKPGYYSNPAFCQQSEFYSQQRPAGSVRRSPVGAQTNHVVFDTSLGEIRREGEEEECVDNVEEQEFYEEVIVDDKGFIKGKKFVVVAQNQEGRKYIQSPQDETLKGSRYGQIQETRYSTAKNIPNSRCEYIPMQEQDVKLKRSNSKRSPVRIQEERVEVAPGIIHRYAVIETEEETDLSDKNNRYALVPVNELNRAVQNDNRYEYIPGSSSPIKIQPNPNRYEYIQTSPSRNTAKYDYITQSTPQKPKINVHREYQNPPRPGTNPIATQKLYQLLSTPKKSRNNGTALTPQKVLSPRKVQSPPLSPIPKDPFHTPKSSPQKVARLQPSSRAQQKLNYAVATKHMAQDKRSTAIVPPMCSSPIQSVYSETTYSQKSESWMNLSTSRPATGRGLSAAALILFLCGNVISGLSFYMISQLGKWYYLDFSLAAGFTCIIMGLLGFRSRNVDWLPNRHYLSGFLILCVFSILTCAGLSILLIKNPEPGTPLADMTSGAVCGFSVLILLLSTTGLVSSYCCKYPPPDNRVEHCSPGLTV